MPMKIYIADDDNSSCLLMARALEGAGYAVKCFADGASLVKAFESIPCDMAILEAASGSLDGVGILKWLRARSVVPVILVSEKSKGMDCVTALGYGGDDYIEKPVALNELTARVNAIFRRIELERARHMGRELAVGGVRLNPATRECTIAGRPAELTPLEFRLMAYLMERVSLAVSREELLREVWGYDCAVDSRATDDLVKRLRRKLNGCAVRIEAVWGFGFRLIAESDD